MPRCRMSNDVSHPKLSSVLNTYGLLGFSRMHAALARCGEVTTNIQGRLRHIRHLGHTSKTVTERHYINRRLVVPDYRAATERLAPGSDTSDDPADGL